jgi:hypothetical protein
MPVTERMATEARRRGYDLRARRRRARASRSRRLARVDVGLGLLLALAVLLASPGLAIGALVGLLVLAACGASLLIQRRRRASRRAHRARRRPDAAGDLQRLAPRKRNPPRIPIAR